MKMLFWHRWPIERTHQADNYYCFDEKCLDLNQKFIVAETTYEPATVAIQCVNHSSDQTVLLWWPEPAFSSPIAGMCDIRPPMWLRTHTISDVGMALLTANQSHLRYWKPISTRNQASIVDTLYTRRRGEMHMMNSIVHYFVMKFWWMITDSDIYAGATACLARYMLSPVRLFVTQADQSKTDYAIFTLYVSQSL